MSPHSETSVTGLDPRLNKGLVSIVIASYGRPEMLARAIRSALSQSHPDLEVIVADDPAPQSCHHVIRSVDDPRFRFHLQDTRVGPWKNWTQAIRMARGEYIVFLGDDDWLSPTFVADHLAALARAPGAAVSFCSMQEVLDENDTLRVIAPKISHGTESNATVFLSAALRQEVFFGAAVFRRRLTAEVWEETEPDGYVADHGLILRLACLRQASCTRVDGPVYFKSVHKHQLSYRYLEITQLQLALMRRLQKQSTDRRQTSLLRHFTAHVAILLARHHAANGDLKVARRLLASAIQDSPTTTDAWSQFLQAYLTPARLIRTARAQRGISA
jgi:glycosyltransferase involved in cell wall biosynthesis